MAAPITVVVGPLATADDDGVSLSQTAAAAQNLIINGAKATGTFVANSICASQTPAGAVDLTINGTLATTNGVAGAGGSAGAVAATVRFPVPTRVYVTTAGDSSARTMTIVGTVQAVGTFGPGVVVSETFTAPNTNTRASTNLYSSIISVSISGAATGAITVGHSGTATLDMGRRIIFTSGGNDSARTVALVGTDQEGNVIRETVTLTNASVASSVLDYLTVTSALTSGSIATTIIVGTNGVAGSPWVRFSDMNSGNQTTIAAVVSGTVNYSIQTTMDDPNAAGNVAFNAPASMTWIDALDTAVVGATATKSSYFAYTPIFARVLLNSGTGSARATFRQADNG